MRISQNFAAAVPIAFNVAGDFFFIERGAFTGNLTVQFFKDGKRLDHDLVAVKAGFWQEVPEGFDRVEITSSFTTATPVVFYAKRGRMGWREPEKAGDVTISNDLSIPAGAALQLVNEEFRRRYTIICNFTGNPAIIRLGDSTVTAARGIELPPGQRETIHGTRAIYGWNPGGVAQNVGILRVLDWDQTS